MSRDFSSDRQRLFTRRAALLLGGQASLFGLLVGRMYYLQITESAKFSTLAEENRINMRLVAPSRSLVYDRFGVKLASNEQNFRLSLIPEDTKDLEATLAYLRQLVRVGDTDLERIRRDIRRNRKFMPVGVADKLTWNEVSAIELRLPELSGVTIDEGEIRHYPYGDATAHVLGYVAAVSEADMKADTDALLSIPGVQIGKTGIERRLEPVMRGKAGSEDLEVNAFGRVIRKVSERAGGAGPPVRLTLDIELQRYVQRRLAVERSASAVVMDTETGAIYALASHPAFDANAFARGIDNTAYQALLNDETKPLSNKAIAGSYMPGSTFKMVTALAALEADENIRIHKVPCYGVMELGNHKFHCWKRGGHGWLDLEGALRESCDIYFYDIARKTGIDAIASVANRLGLGEETGLDIPGERPGLIPTTEWKRRTRKEVWLPGETLIAGIGQGYIQATPLQLAVMTARLVNGGRKVVPHVIKEVEGVQKEQSDWPLMGFAPDHLDQVMAGMNAVCLDKRGTAYASRITTAGQEMGGKTGTAQVRRISMAERAAGIVKNEDREWKFRDHALFVGYAPVNNPRYAVSVVVEHGGGGSKIAAPIARDILMEAQRLDPTRTTRPPMAAADFIPPVADTPTAEESEYE